MQSWSALKPQACRYYGASSYATLLESLHCAISAHDTGYTNTIGLHPQTLTYDQTAIRSLNA